eukprot:4535641-Pleurochrysis_carterae.AAC.3
MACLLRVTPRGSTSFRRFVCTRRPCSGGSANGVVSHSLVVGGKRISESERRRFLDSAERKQRLRVVVRGFGRHGLALRAPTRGQARCSRTERVSRAPAHEADRHHQRKRRACEFERCTAAAHTRIGRTRIRRRVRRHRICRRGLAMRVHPTSARPRSTRVVRPCGQLGLAFTSSEFTFVLGGQLSRGQRCDAAGVVIVTAHAQRSTNVDRTRLSVSSKQHIAYCCVQVLVGGRVCADECSASGRGVAFGVLRLLTLRAVAEPVTSAAMAAPDITIGPRACRRLLVSLFGVWREESFRLSRTRGGGECSGSLRPSCLATNARPCGLSSSMFLRTSRASKSPRTSRIVVRVSGRFPVAPFITRLTSRIVFIDSLRRPQRHTASLQSMRRRAERARVAID